MSRDDQEEKTSKNGVENGAGDELIFGRQPVLEALRSSKPQRILLSEGLKGAIINEITLLARQRKVPVDRLSKSDFSKQVEDFERSQGVAAYVPSFEYLELEELIAISRSSRRDPFLIMLDHLEDPQNLGAVMRTADAAGVDGIIVASHRAVGVTAAVRKVSAGAAERIPVAMVGNLNAAAETLKKEGYWLYAAEADGEEEYYRADYRRPLVLVVGSEGKGLSRLLRQNCDVTLSIPMPGTVAGSLNVAAATAVLVYAVLAQREGWLT